MIIVADSGSTKTNWCLRDKGIDRIIRTDGINPYYQSGAEIEKSIREQLLIEVEAEKVLSVFFYGAGVSGVKQVGQLVEALKACFPHAEVHAGHDLIGAARAALGDKPGIVCIAGTGSNSCYYDGKDIVKNVDSLGLYMGDEGSGGYKGKILIKDYLREALPENLKQAFEARFPERKPEIMEAVYRKPFPNRYLASFVPFIADHKQDGYMRELINRSFTAFTKECLCRYPMHKEVEVHFIGSVAVIFQDILKEVLLRESINVGTIQADPLPSLTDFHFKQNRS